MCQVRRKVPIKFPTSEQKMRKSRDRKRGIKETFLLGLPAALHKTFSNNTAFVQAAPLLLDILNPTIISTSVTTLSGKDRDILRDVHILMSKSGLSFTFDHETRNLVVDPPIHELVEFEGVNRDRSVLQPWTKMHLQSKIRDIPGKDEYNIMNGNQSASSSSASMSRNTYPSS